jgi:hypothetical protein
LVVDGAAGEFDCEPVGKIAQLIRIGALTSRL